MAATPIAQGCQPLAQTTPSTAKLDCTQTNAQSLAERKQAYFDLAIAFSLGLWQALGTAVENGWGGPDSSGKRDWFAGAVSDLFLSRPDTDEMDLECLLLQVMEDEFDVRVEDESEVEVAAEICKMKRICERGDFVEIEQLQQRWARVQGRRREDVFVDESYVEGRSESEADDRNMDSDEDMAGAREQNFVSTRGKVITEVDSEGFVKVVNRRKK